LRYVEAVHPCYAYSLLTHAIKSVSTWSIFSLMGPLSVHHLLTQSKLSGRDYAWCTRPFPSKVLLMLNGLGKGPCNTDSTQCVLQGNVLNGQRFDTSAPEDDDAAQQPQPGPAPMDWANMDHSIPAANNDQAASVAGQAVSNGAQANTQAAPSNGTALPKAPTALLAARAVPAQTAAAAYQRSAGAPQTSKAAAAAAPGSVSAATPGSASAATLTAAPDTGAERPASASASTAEPVVAPRGKGKKGRSRGSKIRPGAGPAGAAPSSLQLASSAAFSLVAMSADIPAKASAKPPRPSSGHKRTAAESPGQQTGTLMAAESQTDKGSQQQTEAAAQAPVCASDAIDPAVGEAVSAALKLMEDCEAEIAYMMNHPDSDID